MNIKYIIKKILGIKNEHSSIKHIASGNLKYGISSRIENSYIEVFHSENNCSNITIGDDCNIMGSLSVYSSDSKIVIGNRVFIGPGTKIICYDGVRIDDDVMISWDCTVMDTNSHSLVSTERLNDVTNWNKGVEYKDWSCVESKKIHIKKRSWIGFKSIILKGVFLGEGTVVASGSVVTKSTEDFSIVGGNPAKFIKKTK